MEGVDFSISDSLWKKTKVVLGADRRWVFRVDPTVACRHYPGTSCHPFCKKGNSDRDRLKDTAKHQIHGHPFFSAENLIGLQIP